jgi:hypothetical protein
MTAAAVIAVMCVAWAMGYIPRFAKFSNWGFGSDWDCTYPGKGDPVCIKRPPVTIRRA